MAEKLGKPPPLTMATRPVPMKLFATWEVDRTPPNCIPRLCSLTLSRLVLLKSLGSDLSSIIIAVKMQSSKRTLRSNELMLPPSGLLDTELELHFSLQYPHFIKRDDTNRLLVMLQRRKRYKNRTILGFKTLAEGTINMSQVLQRQMDVELELLGGDAKDKSNVVARVTVVALSSQPVDHEEAGLRHKRLALSDNADRVGADFSDDDEEFSSNEEGSDSEPMLEEHGLGPRRTRKPSRAKIPATARQRNLKQKFISLLKRFRVSEDLENDQEEIDQKLAGADMDPTDIADLFEELEDMSDSGPEMDTMSISSTPKPSLRPFFSSSRSLVHQDSLVPPAPGEVHPQSVARATTPTSTHHLRNGHHFGTSSSQHQAPHFQCSKVAFREKGSDRQSDESSKKADSDSHPENWTDHEHSDPQQPNPASSPPHAPLAQSESLEKKDGGDRERRSRLFARDRTTSGSKGKKAETPRTPGAAPEQLGGPVYTETSPRKALLEQLSRLLPIDDALLPDHVVLVAAGEGTAANLAARLLERQQRVLTISGAADVKATITCLVSKIQKFCNSSAKPPPPVKVLIAGPDSLVSCVMRQYVEQLSTKPPDWQNHFRFLVVPLGGGNPLTRYLASVDSMYAASFSGDSWRELVDRLEGKADCQEALTRIQRYIVAANSPLPLPVAEAMITYKEKSSDEESSQIFIPFINEVRLGSSDTVSTLSMDMDENQLSPPLLLNSSGSPPATANLSSPAQVMPPDKRGERITPPSSPNVNISYLQSPRESSVPIEPMELQVDYWLLPPPISQTSALLKSEQNKGRPDSNKSTLKTTFRGLQVQRLPQPGLAPTNLFHMNYTIKESKKKTVMRLGKKKEKEKENDAKSQIIEGVTRLICSAKTHNVPLKVSIDGMEWNGVKFFQLSAQWQTHVKHFPIALFNVPDPGSC